jgi:hypothetical protein
MIAKQEILGVAPTNRLADWTQRAAERNKILADNPARLYQFQEPEKAEKQSCGGSSQRPR